MADKFDPLRELENLRQSVGRIIGQGVSSVQNLTNTHNIRLDIYEIDEFLFVRTSAIDGIVPDSIDINIENNILTISGDTRPEATPTNASYILQERRFGPFERKVELNIPVHSSQAKARLKDSVLTITFPIDTSRYAEFGVSDEE